MAGSRRWGAGLRADDDVVVIDVDGATVMPGLVDAHVHVTAATADLSVLPSVVANLRGRARRRHSARNARTRFHHGA